MAIDLATLETELKKRLLEPYVPWGRRQNDEWDRKTNFIYAMPSWSKLKNRTEHLEPELRNYAVNRWFNFWSSVGVEEIFCQQPGVIAAKNQKDRLRDFSIQGISFDHKTTVYPRNFRYPLETAQDNPLLLVEWLYRSQSRGQRFHCGNRLFVVLFDATANGAHWKLRAELSHIRKEIESYANSFDPSKLIILEVGDHMSLSDIIWVINTNNQLK